MRTNQLNISIKFLLFCIFLNSCKNDIKKYTTAYESPKSVLPVSLDRTQTPIPAFGIPGTLVSIKVKGLLPYKDVTIFKFNGQTATIKEITDSVLVAEVPNNATTGIISISINDVVLFGPNFKVDGKINIDNTFKIKNGTNGSVNSLLKTADGKIIYFGSFTNFDNKAVLDPINKLARTYSDGTYDATFRTGKGANGYLSRGIQINNKLYIAGNFSAYDQRTQDISNLTQLNLNGRIDTIGVHTFRRPDQTDTIKYYPTFNGGVDGNLESIYFHQNKILIAGSFTNYIYREYDKPNKLETKDSVIIHKIPMNQIALLNLDGSLDKTFRFDQSASKGYSSANGPISIYYHTDELLKGKILVYGSFTKFDGQPEGYILRLNPDGTKDKTFNPGGSGADYNISYASYNPLTKKYMICGNFKNYNGKNSPMLAMLNQDGTLDQSFIPKIFDGGQPRFVYQLSDGKILVSGIFAKYNYISRSNLLFLTNTGELAEGYNAYGDVSGIISNLYETTSDDGKKALLILGNIRSFNGENVNNLFRITLE
ncbi:delta-60 repeat domain-containing protein [bacterium A37T11]|nr:delta-60 repeat domain-containing protein [bacterium A37T11]